MTRTRSVQLCLTYLVMLVLAMSFAASPLSALDEEQKKIYDSGIHYYDVAACTQTGEQVESAPAIGEGGALYMLGDSITVGAKEQLIAGFDSKDFNPYINASGARSIRGAGQTNGFKTSGLEAAANDKSRINNAGIVVIALGTNQESNFESAIKVLIDNIKSYDSDKSGLKIYWVNIFSKGSGSGYGKIDAKKINNSIAKMASSEGFTVIDTTNKNIELSDSVHPKSPEGTKAFANIVVNGVAGAGGANSANLSVGNNCACGVEIGGSLVGSDNEEKIYNFFTSKQLKPFQAAGILGNIKHESGYEPQRQESIFDRKIPAKSYPAPGGGPGWGIVQFTPGSKFINATKNTTQPKSVVNGKNPDELAVQLEFVWEQIQGKGPVPEDKRILQQIKATTNIRDAVLAFQGNTQVGGSFIGYERPRDQAGSVDSRTQEARRVLAKYGSGSSETSSGPVACAKNENNGEVSGEFSLPVPKKWYNSNPEYFTSPHHGNPNDPGVDIPVPRGTPVYSITAGKVVSAPNEGGYGKGVTIDAGGGVHYVYGHGIDGGTVSGAKQGDTVKAGQLIMRVNDTGSSRGDHLHLSILVNGKEVCPQKFLVSIVKGSPLNPRSLPSSGCTPVNI